MLVMLLQENAISNFFKNIISGLSKNNVALCAFSNHHCSET